MFNVPQYQPATIDVLAGWLRGAEDDNMRWKLIAEFLEEYRWEPPEVRETLVAEAPKSTGDERWDVFLAALAEHLSVRDERGGQTGSRGVC